MFTKNGYVLGTMTKDEEIKVEAQYHWIRWLWFYFMFATLGVVALVSFSLAFTAWLDKQPDMTVALLLVGVVAGVYPFLLYLSLHLTEMICTNRRVVYKTGIISIKTEEIKVERIESIQVKQTFWGRVFGYGNILFSGTGSAKAEFVDVKDPLQVKARIEEAVDESNRERERDINGGDNRTTFSAAPKEREEA